MKYRYQKPHPFLSGYVRTVLVMEGFAEPDGNRLPLFTNGMPALFCRTEKDVQGNEEVLQLALFGKSASADCWTIGSTTTVISYFFHPFTLPVIFNMDAAGLAKEPVDLCNWNAHTNNALRTQLLYAASTDRKVEVLDNLLLQQLQQQQDECAIIRYATDEIMCNPGTEVLSMVLDKLGLNERTFQRMFKKYVGITPNQYRRICQFQLSFSQLKSEKFGTLTDVAYDNGFADQSHFIRSFREFTAVTPNHYLKKGLKGKDQ